MNIYYLGRENKVRLGSKAAVLDRLLAEGEPVPKGFVILPTEEIDPQELSTAIEKIGGFPVAVRSSGLSEDGQEKSFAGQYESYLDVRNIKDLVNKIQSCRNSTKTTRAIAYGSEEDQIPVLIQALVKPKISGVAFTLNPISGKDNEGLIEYVSGQGESLVSGQVDPMRVTVNYEEDPPRHFKELIDSMMRLQIKFGRPQDIEWAIDSGGRLWILQSRPITAIQWRKDIEDHTTADFRDGGVSARHCTPLMYSFYRDSMQVSMQNYFQSIALLSSQSIQRSWINYFYGRPYWNSGAVKELLLRVPGFDEKSFDEQLGIEKSYGQLGPRKTPTNLKTLLPAIPIAVSLERSYVRTLHQTKDFAENFKKREKSLRDRIRTVSADDIGELVIDVLDEHLHTERTYFNVIYNNANFQNDVQAFLDRLEKLTGEKLSILKLLSGVSEISHLEIQRDLIPLVEVARHFGFRSKEWREAKDRFLSHHYYHGDAELDFKEPRWGENPKRIDELVGELILKEHPPIDPRKSVQNQTEIYLHERKRALELISRSLKNRLFYRRRFLKLLRRSRTYIARREAIRDCSTRVYHLLRLILLKAAEHWCKLGILPNTESVYLLTTDEIRELAAKPRKINRSILKYREFQSEGYRNLEPPNELGRDILKSKAKRRGAIRGLGCSSGLVKGRVRVISEVQEANQIRGDEILVTRFTDPGWTPALGIAAGVITEVGGILSHAAVISREYGIPAILNVPNATGLLKDGQLIQMCGDSGEIEVL